MKTDLYWYVISHKVIIQIVFVMPHLGDADSIVQKQLTDPPGTTLLQHLPIPSLSHLIIN